MDIKICKNILRLRKEQGVTQAQLAEYLGLSPQAVSKWELEAAMPDIYLIPKIAFFFDISIDHLFGTSDYESADLLVSKYSAVKNDKNYRTAYDAVNTLLDLDNQNLKALELLCRLEHERSLEYLTKSKVACHKLLSAADGIDTDLEKRARIQLMRFDKMLGNDSFIEDYMIQFEKSKSLDDFNYLILALGHKGQYQEMMRWADDYLESFSLEDQGWIYPNLMEAGLFLGDTSYLMKCFDNIVELNTDLHQIFNAWYLRWKHFRNTKDEKEVDLCKAKLLELLPNQGLNEFRYEKLKNIILDEEDHFHNLI
ncbi:helix-turn-helix transcriptional regulator [Acidaminobacter sp. JC074]|uniref:helix-turn-helix transcriptional regulator n=1 Tax=Acidaminobacter sp. JC074 TaxID=2530199 RepID=UPI001F117C0E|nr:helix-turn-helix transcriptional regulator [Acidaminobacter sp. JC074]MCH4889524.1 helix-turn-helix transcriptional regulator [Acidaminobacter sp. JC074]